MATELELAWAAGLVDGEGCIFIARRPAGGSNGAKNDSYVLGVKVTMCHRPTLERLAALLPAGKLYATPAPKNPKWTPAASWLAQSRQAAEVLGALRPYLVTKAEEADTGLEFANMPLAPRGGRGGNAPAPADLLERRRALYERMRAHKRPR